MSRRTIAIVPHTHWDREWYEPFQTFRLGLVDLLDELLDLLEGDPSYQEFLLDGQMAVVDDYLEVRPDAEERIRNLAVAGRLTMGPWYILMDEFLVSGETIIRNLEMGMRRGAAFGGVMEVGYLPDMFGHIAQMPQILNLAGLTDAVLWRGVPSQITKTGFTWVAPDGSSVRAELLPTGYGNGAALPGDAKALIQRAADHEEEIASFLTGPMLWMNGSDHLKPQAHLGRVVAEANALQDDFRFEVTSLPAYLSNVEREGLEVHEGEMRSGFRSNVLMGVTSNRVDVKLAAARTERSLERRAEPLAALFSSGAWPEQLLHLAWREVIRNSAHDSICACSVDEVVDAVLHRFAEARQIGDGLASRALSRFSNDLAQAGDVVLNPTQWTRGGVVEIVIAGEDLDERAVQVLSERSALPGTMEVDAATLSAIIGLLQGPRINDETWIQGVEVDEDDDGLLQIAVKIGPTPNPKVDLDEPRRVLFAKLAMEPDLRARVHLDQPRIRKVAAVIGALPGYSWAPFQPVAPSNPVVVEELEVDGVDSVALSNGLVNVIIDPVAGTFSIDGRSGYGQLVDEGDFGDSYNYSPPAVDTVVDQPTSVRLEVTRRGPICASVDITSSYTWPSHINESRSRRVGEVLAEVVTTVELKADDQAVYVRHTLTNPARDHRLRVLLPLPEPVGASVAECAFGTVSRGLVAEGRPDELGLATYPSRRFVQAGSLTVAHEGLNEYQLIDLDQDERTASTLALTVLRATGMLSRLGMKYRPFPAGPLTPVEGLQMVGSTIEARYAITMGDVDPYAFADHVLMPHEVLHSFGGGHRPASGSEFEVEGAVVSSVRRERGSLEVRVFNPSSAPSQVHFGARTGWQFDLRGRPIAPFDGGFELRGHGIATVRFTDR